MKKFTNLNEVNTDNILKVARANNYSLCVEQLVGCIGIQDEESLSEFLEDIGVTFIDNDAQYYYYKLGNTKFKVKSELVEYDEDDYAEIYLIFDNIIEI